MAYLGLEVGSTAYVMVSGRSNSVARKGKVTKITPTGQITVELPEHDGGTYNIRFGDRGNEICAGNFGGAFLISEQRAKEHAERISFSKKVNDLRARLVALGQVEIGPKLLEEFDALRPLVADVCRTDIR